MGGFGGQQQGQQGQQQDPQQQLSQMLDRARQASAQQWPQQKQQMLAQMQQRMQQQNPSGGTTITQATKDIGKVLDEARALSAANYEAKKTDLTQQLSQAMMKGMGRSQGGSQPQAQGVGATSAANYKLVKERYAGPLFDAHAHLKPDVQIEDQIAIFKQAGLSGMILFCAVRDGQSPARMTKQAGGDFVFPCLHPIANPQSDQLPLDDALVAAFEQSLGDGTARGFGELSFHHKACPQLPKGTNTRVDSDLALKIFDLAAKNGAPLNVHVEHEFSGELERALARNRKATVVWAHCGDASAAIISALMRRHPNLYADISCRNPIIYRQYALADQSLIENGSGRIKADWKNLFEAFPDRFLLGFDIFEENRYQSLTAQVDYYRSVLGQLSPTTAEKIAHQNAKRIYGIEK